MRGEGPECRLNPGTAGRLDAAPQRSSGSLRGVASSNLLQDSLGKQKVPRRAPAPSSTDPFRVAAAVPAANCCGAREAPGRGPPLPRTPEGPNGRRRCGTQRPGWHVRRVGYQRAVRPPPPGQTPERLRRVVCGAVLLFGVFSLRPEARTFTNRRQRGRLTPRPRGRPRADGGGAGRKGAGAVVNRLRPRPAARGHVVPPPATWLARARGEGGPAASPPPPPPALTSAAAPSPSGARVCLTGGLVRWRTWRCPPPHPGLRRHVGAVRDRRWLRYLQGEVWRAGRVRCLSPGRGASLPARPGGCRREGSAAGLRGSRSEGGKHGREGECPPGRAAPQGVTPRLGPEARGGGCSGRLKALGGEEGGLPRWSCQASPMALVCSHP